MDGSTWGAARRSLRGRLHKRRQIDALQHATSIGFVHGARIGSRRARHHLVVARHHALAVEVPAVEPDAPQIGDETKAAPGVGELEEEGGTAENFLKILFKKCL